MSVIWNLIRRQFLEIRRVAGGYPYRRSVDSPPNIVSWAICTATSTAPRKVAPMAAPRRYSDPLRTGQFGPPCCSRALYMSDLKLLVIVSRGACRAWIALELGLNFGENIVDLDLFPVHPRTNKDDIYANIIWNSMSVFEWFTFTCVYPLVKRGNHLIITQDDG
ncbi:hypothetical protein BU15DRAFT_66716 [Melanogaster broomeanus]|nr:hypothetical protein BU15DRAFT_66716 [Melanogaster broomeanus]